MMYKLLAMPLRLYPRSSTLHPLRDSRRAQPFFLTAGRVGGYRTPLAGGILPRVTAATHSAGFSPRFLTDPPEVFYAPPDAQPRFTRRTDRRPHYLHRAPDGLSRHVLLLQRRADQGSQATDRPARQVAQRRP